MSQLFTLLSSSSVMEKYLYQPWGDTGIVAGIQRKRVFFIHCSYNGSAFCDLVATHTLLTEPSKFTLV